MATLYHGTSSRFISNIIKNGLGVLDTAGKYAEIRNILSKYIKPDILTDEFFDKYAGFIDSGSFLVYIFVKNRHSKEMGRLGFWKRILYIGQNIMLPQNMPRQQPVGVLGSLNMELLDFSILYNKD